MKRKQDGGFTLVELIITMALISVLSLTVANFISDWLNTSSLAKERTELLANAEQALDTINTDVRLSGSADENNRWQDANAPEAPSNELSWQSGSNILVLAKASIDKSNTIIFSDPAQYITMKDNEVYFVNDGVLYRRTLAASTDDNAAVTTCPAAEATELCPADKVVATNVTSFSITYFDANNQEVAPMNARSVQLNITLQKMHNGQPIEATYNTRMVFRNV